jgi:putative salt-induced outer membrane protein YdiY
MLKKQFFIFLCALLPSICTSEIIELTNGDVLNAKLNKKSAGGITIDHPALGTITIPNDQIASIKPSPEDEKEEASTDALAAAETEDGKVIIDEGVFGSGFLKDWDRKLSVGLNGTSGPSDTANFRADFKTSYKDEEKRWDFSMYYLFASADSKTTDNRFTANLLRDWLIIDSNWFYFANGGYDYDQFKNWDHRLRLGGGSGYHWIETGTVEFDTRQGLNLNYSIFPAESNTLKLEALLGIDWRWQISEKQTITFSNVIYPALTDLGEYRNVTDFEWKHDLDYYHGLAIKLGFHNEYDTTEKERNDLKYYASIVWGL